MTNYDAKYAEYLTYFNNCLDKRLLTLDKTTSSIITDAMIYAVAGGGKRVRPVLCFAVADMLGISLKEVEVYALAIEMIHSYSLVHDDLPAMDNDDYRRGKLSTHKKFGEAFGVLAGDALLNFAFEYALSKENFSLTDAKALKFLAICAGSSGMIGGQTLDLLNEKNDNVNEDDLYKIYINKTSKLLVAPIIIASIFADKDYSDKLSEYGLNLGVMFQISDDIIDEKGDKSNIGKTPGKDKVQDKLTSIKTFGFEGSLHQLKYHYDKCLNIISEFDNNQFLLEFTQKMFERTK